MRKLPHFAHIVGTPSHNDPLPGLDDFRRADKLGAGPDRSGGQEVVVSFSKNKAREPLRRLLLFVTRSCLELWEGFRRLGLPRNSVASKFRYHKQAFSRPQDAVMLDGSTQRMLRAKQAGDIDTQNLAYRPKPKFRTSEPGVRTIFGFNLLFVLWLLCGSW